MLDEFNIHNLQWKNLGGFIKDDPHLSSLQKIRYVHPLDWWKDINWKEPGIFILTGGRQIGKSTSLKLLFHHLLQKKIFNPVQTFYLPCDQVFDAPQLSRIIKSFLENKSGDNFLLAIDEITFIKDWPRVIKGFADEGWFRKGFCIVTGSDTHLLKEAMSHFPGRRGHTEKVDFHLLPLTFGEMVQLIDPNILSTNFPGNSQKLLEYFHSYLKCGGYLRAINDLFGEGAIRPETYATFEQWVRGDFSKRGKNEQTLLTVLKNIMEINVSQISFSSLSARAGEMTKETFINYCELLERMDILFTLQAFDQNKLLGFPKKARKFHFCDPFIRNTLEKWVIREKYLHAESNEGHRVEAAAAAQFHPRFPVYYLKGQGEVDLVVIVGNRSIPMEVKWSENVRSHDLKELKKYPHSLILSKLTECGLIDGIPSFPLASFLAYALSKNFLADILKSKNKR